MWIHMDWGDRPNCSDLRSDFRSFKGVLVFASGNGSSSKIFSPKFRPWSSSCEVQSQKFRSTVEMFVEPKKLTFEDTLKLQSLLIVHWNQLDSIYWLFCLTRLTNLIFRQFWLTLASDLEMLISNGWLLLVNGHPLSHSILISPAIIGLQIFKL